MPHKQAKLARLDNRFLNMICCGVFKSDSKTETVVTQCADYTPVSNGELKLVQVLFRHGARTPINFTKGVPSATYDMSLNQDLPETVFRYQVVRYSDGEPADDTSLESDLRNVKLKGGCYASILTIVGQRQIYELGQKIRDGYFADLDITVYSKNQLRLRTTQLTRTIKSLRCILAGMFGNENLDEVGPIPFMVKPVLEEDLFPNKLTCPALRIATDLALSRLNSIPNFRHDKEILLKALDLSSSETIDFASVRDDLACRMAHGLELPPELVPHLDMIEDNASRTLYAVYSGKTGHSKDKGLKEIGMEVTKLAIGRLVHTIISHMERYVSEPCLVKLYLYSAHDTSLTPMMEALGIWDFAWPPFAANIIFELYFRERDSHYFVRVLYCGQPKVLREATGPLISFNDFRRILQRYRLPHFLYPRNCMIQYVA